MHGRDPLAVPGAQGPWAAALLDPALPPPPGLVGGNGSAVAARLAVHRNNVVVGLVDVLAAGFPVVQQLVGDEFFRAMAAVFVRRSPPRSSVLMHYGSDFAGFIEGFAPAQCLPYLPDVARLEWARLEACHAADALALTPQSAAPLLARAQQLGPAVGRTRLICHPALRTLTSPHAVLTLWAAHQQHDPAALAGLDTGQPEAVLVLRPALEVLVLGVPAGAAAFASALLHQAELAEAADTALAADVRFDLTAALELLLVHGALAHVLLP